MSSTSQVCVNVETKEQKREVEKKSRKRTFSMIDTERDFSSDASVINPANSSEISPYFCHIELLRQIAREHKISFPY